MGGIQGKRRFSCGGCQQLFSWRLDLIDHIKSCKSHFSRGNKYQHLAQIYILDICFLCGLNLRGTHSEEASFLKGNQMLYHSKQTLAEVLEVITQESSLSTYVNHTIALCKSCMNSVNKYDETNMQLQDIAKSIRTVYRTRISKTQNRQWKRSRSSLRNNNERSPDHFNEEEHEEDNEISEEDTEDLQSSSTLREQVNKDYDVIEKTEKEYKCDCGKVIQGLDALVEHQLLVGCKVKKNKFLCKYCGSTFGEKKLLIFHKKACIKESLVNGAHECDICGRRFLVRGRVETHKRNVHSIGTADQQLCSYCGRTFGSSYNMKNHLAREHGIGQIDMVVCQLCGKKFSDKSSCQHHMKNIHGDHKFDCEHCGKKFATQGMRNHHINEMHNDSYNYKCNICGELFKVSFRYRYHMRKVHSSLQHGCDDCGRTFTMRSDLYRHIRGVHMGIRDPKRYPCKLCGRMFPSMYKVKRHASSHGILETKYTKNSMDHDSKGGKSGSFLQIKQTDALTPLIVSDDPFVSTSFVKGMNEATLMQRKIGNITTTLAETATSTLVPGESSISRSLTGNHIDSTDTASIDVHQLPTAEIYTTPHITTLTPEILQGNMTSDVVTAETMAVGSVSSIVVSASTVQECLGTDELHPSEQSALHEQNSHGLSHIRRGGTLIQPDLQHSLVPVHQICIFEDSVPDTGHNSFPVRSSNQIITVSQCTNQIMSGAHIPSQVICIPHSTNDTVTTHESQTTFFCTPNTTSATFSDSHTEAPNHSM